MPKTLEQVDGIRRAAIESGASEDDVDRLLAELESSELWVNDRYVVTVTRRPDDGSVAELSIRRADRKHPHDWRDLQRIKTEVAGADVEAAELYPAEDRLMDTANQFYLWCLPPGRRFPFGFDLPRNVTEDGVPGSQQRPVPDDWKEASTG